MLKEQIHSKLLSDLISGNADDTSILLYMILFHLYDIVLRQSVVIENINNVDGDCIIVPAVTRNHAYMIASSIWDKGDKRANPDYWQSRFLRRTPYESVDHIPPDLRPQFHAQRNALASHPWVLSIQEG
jgi:hypothetical protein